MKRKYIYLIDFLLLCALIALDQITKYLVRAQLTYDDFILIPKILRFTYVQNNGAVFGILRGQRVPLLILATVMTGVIVYMYTRIPPAKRYFPLRIVAVCICAGAIGNLADRFMFGYVTDFIYAEFINFFVFNLADCYITVSAAALVLLLLFAYKDDSLITGEAKQSEIDEGEIKQEKFDRGE